MSGVMGLRESFTSAYFDLVYNRVYDFTTARTTSYRRWQEACLSKLQLAENDKVLCVGAGTGNEVVRLLERNRHLDIVTIDASRRALAKSCRKARKCGRDIESFRMDAQALDFPDGSFDVVLCLHLMDFLIDQPGATREIFRVLRKGGHFSITYPLNEGLALGISVVRESMGQTLGSRRYREAVIEVLAMLGAGLAYPPLLFRARRKFYSREQLQEMFGALELAQFQIEEHCGYRDLIAYGRK